MRVNLLILVILAATVAVQFALPRSSFTWLDLWLIVFAINQLVEIWRHSDLTHERRAIIENYLGRHWWAEMLLCGWCTSVWTALLVLWYHVPVIHELCLVLAVSRQANLLNDGFSKFWKTPGRKDATTARFTTEGSAAASHGSGS